MPQPRKGASAVIAAAVLVLGLFAGPSSAAMDDHSVSNGSVMEAQPSLNRVHPLGLEEVSIVRGEGSGAELQACSSGTCVPADIFYAALGACSGIRIQYNLGDSVAPVVNWEPGRIAPPSTSFNFYYQRGSCHVVVRNSTKAIVHLHPRIR